MPNAQLDILWARRRCTQGGRRVRQISRALLGGSQRSGHSNAAQRAVATLLGSAHMTRSSSEKLTEREWRTMLARQGGVCATPGCMSIGPFEADHVVPNALERGKPTQLLCEPCHKRKTFGRAHLSDGDVSKIAKVKRLRDGKTQYDKRTRNGPKLRGRGFEGWRNFSGEIVRKER